MLSYAWPWLVLSPAECQVQPDNLFREASWSMVVSLISTFILPRAIIASIAVLLFQSSFASQLDEAPTQVSLQQTVGGSYLRGSLSDGQSARILC